MQIGPRLQLGGHVERRKSRPWAIVLFVGYVLSLLSELSMIRFSQGSDGRWIASTVVASGRFISLFVLMSALVCLFVAILFITYCYKESRTLYVSVSQGQVNGYDLVYMFAWLHTFNTCLLLLYGLFLPGQLFAEGTVGSFVESASVQLFILVISFVWFRDKSASIGFIKPKQFGRMLLILILFFLFIAVALDLLVTNPIADWLQLSSESQREQAIQTEIVQARAHNWIGIMTSLSVIGIIVPIAEEVLFRGIVQTYLVRRWGAVWGILVASLWFALMHVDVALFAPLFSIGLGLGYLRYRYQSIWGAILLHAMNNMAGVLSYFF